MTTSQNDTPLVVACLATWNGESSIETTLSSLAVQTYPNLKVLISDDASTDGTAAICEDFIIRCPHFELLRKSQRSGWVDNINTLLNTAQGDYIFFVSHDDVLDPACVARLVEVLKSRPGAILAFSDTEFVDLHRNAEIQEYVDLDGVEGRIRRVHRMLRRRGPWWVPYHGIFRASAAKAIGGLKKNLAGEFSADWPWLVHMAILGEFIRVPEVHYKRILRTKSLSRSWTYTARDWLAATLACAGEIRHSRMSLIEKMILHVSLLMVCLRFIREGLVFHMKRLGSLKSES